MAIRWVSGRSSASLPNQAQQELWVTLSRANAARLAETRDARLTAAHDAIVAQPVAESAAPLAAFVLQPAAPRVVLQQRQRQRQH